MTKCYRPEGHLLDTPNNQALCASPAALRRAMEQEVILEGSAILCGPEHGLWVDVGPFRGYMPRTETALGIADGSTRDIAILSRVGRPVCFTVEALEEREGHLCPILSRRRAQELAQAALLDSLSPGQVLPVRVTHLEPFGCFVDIGCGIVSLLPIDAISVSRISHPRDRFSIGQNIFVAVRSIAEDGKICLSHKELLGTWEENAAKFRSGETVAGIIRSVEPYGIFVELAPNLAGLAESKSDVRIGQQASVYIKSLIPNKMKIKLIIVDSFDAEPEARPFEYFIQSGRLERFRYSPESSDKTIETLFSPEAVPSGEPIKSR